MVNNIKKSYLTDTGFASLGRPFTENRGRILENVVAIELFRRNQEMYYFKEKNECDFILIEGTEIKCALQVCWQVTERNKKREVRGLVEACKALSLSSGVIMTYDQEGQINEKDIRISILPVWKWLLLDNVPEISNQPQG